VIPLIAAGWNLTQMKYGDGMIFETLYSDRLDYELGGNDSAVLFTTARRKNSINEGLREFADLTECWTRSATITCSNAVADYNLLSTVNIVAGDFIRLAVDGPEYRRTDASSNVTYTHGDDLPRRDIEWLNAHESGWRSCTGATAPQSYYLDADGGALNLGLYPPPTISTSEAGALIVPYVARPSSMTSTGDTPYTDASGVTRTDLEPYHQALVHYAAHRLELLRTDTAAPEVHGLRAAVLAGPA
jgi:hypothetical protein